MEPPLARYRCKSTASTTVQKKVGLLNEQIAQIESLELQLQVLRKEHEDLLEELTPCYDQASQVYDYDLESGQFRFNIRLIKPSPVEKCPEEILCMIFDLTLSEYHYRIRTLLLVCRRWYQTVMNTPKLWAKIQISNAFDLFDTIAKSSLGPYISACIERSNNLALDVMVNLEDLADACTFFERQALQCVPLVEHKLYEWLEETFARINWPCYSSYYDVQLEKAFNHLLGEDAQYMARWDTLDLIFPMNWERNDAKRAWERLSPVMSQLSACEIDFLPESWRYEGSPYPVLSAAKSIKLSHPAPISWFQATPAILQHLDIEFDEPQCISDLASFPLLRSLTLRCNHKFGVEKDEPPITLPNLQDLTIIGAYSALGCFSLQFPKLNRLAMESNELIDKLPTLMPKHVQWSPYHVNFKILTDESHNASIMDLLSAYPRVATLTVHQLARETAINVVSECKKRGDLPDLARLLVGRSSSVFGQAGLRDAEITLQYLDGVDG